MPNWQEAIYKAWYRVESGKTGNKSWPVIRTGFEPGATACKPHTLTTAPRLLLMYAYGCMWRAILRIGVFFGFSWNLFAVGRVSLFLLKLILFKFSEAAFNRLNFHSLLFKYKEYQYELMNECDHLIKQRRERPQKFGPEFFRFFSLR